jgi:hypothetical protein
MLSTTWKATMSRSKKWTCTGSIVLIAAPIIKAPSESKLPGIHAVLT